MRHFLLLLSVIFLVSCGHTYKNSKEFTEAFKIRANQKSDTLVVNHQECTDCLDLYVHKGVVSIPPDLKEKWGLYPAENIKVCGNFPMDLIDRSDWDFDVNLYFKIIGKVIKIDTSKKIGNMTLFYVESWEKVKPDFIPNVIE